MPDNGFSGVSCGEIIKGFVCRANDALVDKRRTFGDAIFGVFEAILPFQNYPAFKMVLCQLAEDAIEINKIRLKQQLSK